MGKQSLWIKQLMALFFRMKIWLCRPYSSNIKSYLIGDSPFLFQVYCIVFWEMPFATVQPLFSPVTIAPCGQSRIILFCRDCVTLRFLFKRIPYVLQPEILFPLIVVADALLYKRIPVWRIPENVLSLIVFPVLPVLTRIPLYWSWSGSVSS